MDGRRGESSLFLRVDYPDEDLRRRIESFLRSRHFSALRNLEVGVTSGVVTLKGEVGSFYEKQVALDTCRRVAGVLCTVDQLLVEQRQPSVSAHRSGVSAVKAGAVEPGGAARRLEFPTQTGVSSF